MSAKIVKRPIVTTLDAFRREAASNNPRWNGTLKKVDVFEVYWSDQGELVIVTTEEWQKYLVGKTNRIPDPEGEIEIDEDGFMEILSPAENKVDEGF